MKANLGVDRDTDSWSRCRHLAVPILDEMSVSKRQMRQSNKRGNYFDSNADKTRAAIKPALVKLDINVSGFVGVIGQFADKEAFPGFNGLEEYLQSGRNFSQLSSE